MEEIVEKPASIADLKRLEAEIEEALISVTLLSPLMTQ
jgi:hypothetical protein